MTAHIVIVEDDRVTRMRLAGYLRGQGYRVTEVEDADAMQQVIDTTAELLVLDIGLEGKDGLTITREQRARLTCGHHPSDRARRSRSTRIVGLEMGADDYVDQAL